MMDTHWKYHDAVRYTTTLAGIKYQDGVSDEEKNIWDKQSLYMLYYSSLL